MSSPADLDEIARELRAELDDERDGLVEESVRSGLALEQPPNALARGAELGGRYGLDADTASRNLPELEREERFRAVPWDQVRQSPGMQGFLSDPARAAAALDDVPAGLALRDALKQSPQPDPGLLEVLGNRFNAGRRTAFELPDTAWPLIVGALGGPAASDDQRREYTRLQSEPVGPTERDGWLDDILGAPLEQLPILANTIGASVAGGAVGAVPGAALGALAGAPAGGVGAVPGALGGAATGFTIGAKAGSALSVFKLESAAAFAEFRGQKDVAGQEIPEEFAAAAAVTVGAINAGLELVGFQALAKTIPGLSGLVGRGRQAVTASVARRMLNPELRAALLAGARKVVGALGTEVATELGQEATNIEAGRVLRGEGPGLSGEEAARLGDTAVQTALGTLPFASVGQLVDVRMQRVARARENQAQLEAASQALASSKTRDLSPALFRQLTEAMAREAGIGEVSIPADALVEHYAGDLDALRRDVPEISMQDIFDAQAHGGDLPIPVGRYFGALDPKFGAALAQDVRLRPEDLTGREAVDAESGIEGEVERALQRVDLEADEAGQAADVARAEVGVDTPAITDPAGLMTPREFETYNAAAFRARVAAREQVSRELDKQHRLEDAAEAAEDRTLARIRRDFTEDAEREVGELPVERVRAFLALNPEKLPPGEKRSTGPLGGLIPVELQGADREPMKLDRDWVVGRYGEELAGRIPRNMMQRGGLHPDLVAEVFGYPNGFRLVEALANAPTREQAVADRVEAKMTARFGDLHERRAEAAAVAAQNDEQIRVLQIEERALARATRDGRQTPRGVARGAARRILGGKRVRELLSARRYRDAAAVSARRAVEAIAARDYQTALDLKRRQILNLALEIEARGVREEIESAQRYFLRFENASTRATLGKTPGDFLEQIDALLERFDFRVGKKQGAARIQLAAWVEKLRAEGREVSIAPRLLEQAKLTPWQELSVDELRELREAVQQIEHLARDERIVTASEKQRELQQVEAEIVAAIEDAAPAKGRPARITKTELDKARGVANSIDASLTRVEFLVDYLSGGDPKSTLRATVWNPLAAAVGEYNRRTQVEGKKLDALRAQIGEDKLRTYNQEIDESRLADSDGRPQRLTKWDVVMIALNTGNASNLQKLLGGRGWDLATVQAVLDTHMTEADWRFVQGVWDQFDALWPEVAGVSRRMTGVTPPRIEAQAVQTRWGTFRGGYFPVAYDYDLSRTGQRTEIADMMPGATEGFTKPAVGHGFTHERTAVEAPLRLEPSVIPNHLDQVLLYVTHAEAVKAASRVISRHKVDEAIQGALGPEFSYTRFWRPWLQGIARDTVDPGPLGTWSSIARWARLRGSVFQLAFRASTVLIQPSGLFNGLQALRDHLPRGTAPGALIRGAWEAYGSGNPLMMRRRWAEVQAQSPFMRDRMGTMDRDLRDVMRQATRRKQVSDKVAAFGMGLISGVQFATVDVPVWLAARRVGIERMGLSAEEAVQLADSMVRMSQGSGTKMDQSAFERGSEILKATAPFYSYNNLVYNQLRLQGRLTRGVRNVPGFLASYALIVLLPGLFAWTVREVLKGRPTQPREDEDGSELRRALAEIGVGGAVSGVPWLRDVYQSMVSGSARSAFAPQLFYREAVDLVDVKDGMDLMFDAARNGALYGAVPGSDAALRAAEGFLRGDEK